MKHGLPIPREHGAWAMLYAPFLIGWIVTGWNPATVLLFAVCITFFFLLHEPLFILVRLHPGQPGSREKYAGARSYLILYSALAAGAALPLIIVYDRLWLIPTGFGALLFLAMQTYLMSARFEKSIPAELLVVVGLTSTAPVIRYVLIGRFDEPAVLLWMLNIAFFTSSIFYVKMRVERFARKRNSPERTRDCLLYHALLVLLLLALFWYEKLPWLAAVAFLPIVYRAVRTVWIRDQRLSLMRIGLAEIGYTCLFVVLLAISLQEFAEMPG